MDLLSNKLLIIHYQFNKINLRIIFWIYNYAISIQNNIYITKMKLKRSNWSFWKFILKLFTSSIHGLIANKEVYLHVKIKIQMT